MTYIVCFMMSNLLVWLTDWQNTSWFMGLTLLVAFTTLYFVLLLLWSLALLFIYQIICICGFSVWSDFLSSYFPLFYLFPQSSYYILRNKTVKEQKTKTKKLYPMASWLVMRDLFQGQLSRLWCHHELFVLAYTEGSFIKHQTVST